MRASESHFESLKSERILFFINLICSSISGPKALKKKTVCVLPYSIAVKSYRTFSKLDKTKCAVVVQNRWGRKNISE